MAARKGMSEKAAVAVLKMRLPEDSPLREELERHGLAATGAQAIFFALFRKAVAGDVSAAKLIREAAGEKVGEPEPPKPVGTELSYSAGTCKPSCDRLRCRRDDGSRLCA